MSTPAPIRDVRALVGMDTRVAWLLAGFYLCSETALALSSAQHVRQLWPIAAALGITVAATVALLRVRPDPLPAFTTAALVASIPASTAVTLFNLPVPPVSVAQMWVFGACTVTATFMCVRGRTPAAWAGLLSMIAVATAWSATTGQGIGHGFTVSGINLGPLAMSTFFAYTLRPAAHSIFRLREESTRQAGSEAAAAAALDERRDQTQRLDRMVRPILQTIAGPAPLDIELRDECRLVEAHLRDTLRAPVLATEPVTTAAQSARRRGVDVILIDDHGLDHLNPAARQRILTAIAIELDKTSAGSAHIRILPPSRAVAATIVINDPDSGVHRIELDPTARTAVG
ncbi:hypothetical protein [Nocardia nova]|uniref:hypothetical protein n=1 Tax=Nocardia nova TaxID=37330 RepID=UPI0033CE7CF0